MSLNSRGKTIEFKLVSITEPLVNTATGTNSGQQSGTSGVLQNGGPEIYMLIQQMKKKE